VIAAGFAEGDGDGVGFVLGLGLELGLALALPPTPLPNSPFGNRVGDGDGLLPSGCLEGEGKGFAPPGDGVRDRLSGSTKAPPAGTAICAMFDLSPAIELSVLIGIT
jgi:hypothetical protein